MSRIGKKPITFNAAKIDVASGVITVEGKKGKLSQEIHEAIDVKLEDKQINVSVKEGILDKKKQKAFHGLYRSLIQNMVTGVEEGYEIKLEIVGVGFKATLQKNILVLNLGFSHPINFELPEGISAQVENKNTQIILTGIDKQLIGNTAASIRRYYPPEPYKGKGVKYADEVIRRKKGKRVA